MSQEDQDKMLSMGFEAGVACITQTLQKYEGKNLRAVIDGAHSFSLRQLSGILEVPEEDVALQIEPFATGVQARVDAIIEEVG